MKYFFGVYGVWHGANAYISNNPINYNHQPHLHYLAVDKISAICGNQVTMTNGDYYDFDDYNMDKLKEFLHRHEFRFVNILGHEWSPSTPTSTVR